MDARALVAGVGNPWLGDLDFGPRFIRRYRDSRWPPGVILIEAAWAAHRMLHELQQLEPERLIVVSAYPRGERGGVIRRYRPQRTPPGDDEVQARLGEGAGGVIDLDHTLVVAHFYGALPDDTVVVEVEPVERRFGETLSARVESAFEPVRRLVETELERPLRSGPRSGWPAR